MPGVTQAESDVVDLLRGRFPDLPAETVRRQVSDAEDSLALFGLDPMEQRDMVERLARSHLEALDALRHGRQ